MNPSKSAPSNATHSENSGDGISEESIPTKRGWRFRGTIVTLALLNLICAIDATILSVALPTIAAKLPGTTAIQTFWVGTSFLLCSTVFQPLWASFSHIMGTKVILLAALLLFSVGSIIASVTKDVSTLILGRALQGIGGGGLVAGTYILFAHMFQSRERGRYMAIFSVQWAVGTVVGPVIGGAFVEKTTWRWIFWLNIPFCLIAAVSIPIFIRLNTKQDSLWTKLRAFDWFGAFMFVSAVTSCLIPITWGGVMYDWSSWRTLVPLLLGACGLVGFAFYCTVRPEPLIRPTLFNSPTAIAVYFGTFIHGLLVWALLYFVPLYLEVGKSYSSLKSGIALFPFTFTVALAAVIVSFIISKTGRYNPSLWFGWFLTTLGMGLLIRLRPNTNLPSWVFLSLVRGIGTGMLFSAQGFAAQASASNADLPFAGAFYTFFRAFGQTIGLAISGVIFQNTFKKKIEATSYAPFGGEWAQNATSFVEAAQAAQRLRTGPDDELNRVLVQTFVDSLGMVWKVMCILAGIAFVISIIWIGELGLDRVFETDQAFQYDEEASSYC